MIEYKINYGFGLGILPVSLFCGLEREIEDSVSIYNQLFDEIVAQGVMDVIFHNLISINETTLRWLVPRLIFNSVMPCHTSIITRNAISEHVIPNRRILIISDGLFAKSMFTLLDKVRELDIILVDTDNIDFLTFVRNHIYQKEIKIAKIMYNPYKLQPSEVLKGTIYDVLPCFADYFKGGE